MDPLSIDIRHAPLSYLPEASLTLLWHFRQGYDLRYWMSNRTYAWSDDNHNRAFARWVRKRFSLRAGRALGHFPLITSFSANEVEALSNYFQLLEEFCQQSQLQRPSEPSGEAGTLKELSFVELIKTIREKPTSYLADRSFFGYCAFLMGEQRAYQDLQLPIDEGRGIFDRFKIWVEEKKNEALPRSWFKVIAFWSGGYHCAHTSHSAFSLFYKWLDEYASEIGQANLFCVL